MLKKIGAILLVFIILTVSSVSVFATTDSAITSSSINGDAKNGESSTAGAITTGNAITAEGDATSEGAITSKGSDPVKKTEFEAVLEKAAKNGTAINNGQFVMTITSPDMDKDSTYVKSYVLSGNSKYNDVIISIYKYNEDKNAYEPMYNTDGESSWAIGDFRLFSKEIVLTKGINKIKIVSYRTSQKEEAKVENIQINCFTIELLNESIIKKVFRKTTEIGESLGLENLFNKNKTSK